MNTDKKVSRIKLWISLGNQTQVWYCFLAENKHSDHKIIERMIKRIIEKKLQNQFRRAVFYCNITNKKIRELSGPVSASVKGKIKLWIGFPDMKDNEVWHNPVQENVLQNHEIIDAMRKRILEDRHDMNFNIAQFYNEQGFLIKTINGKLNKHGIKTNV